jgi:AP-1 complex subunit sigma 1/2
LDIIFNFEKAYFMWDEFVLGGEVQETSKKNVLKAISDQDMIQEVEFCLIFLKIFSIFFIIGRNSTRFF